jgi:hypothetical protein
MSLLDTAWLMRVRAERERRARILRQAADDIGLQATILAACELDPEVYFSLFCWGFDTRESPPETPILAWETQRLMRDIYLGRACAREPGMPMPMLIEKSRDYGATDTILDAALYVWRFRAGRNQGMSSRTGEEVDDRSATSLFGRLRWKIAAWPPWLRPAGWVPGGRACDRKRLLINPANGNLILGATSSPDVFRSRRLWQVLIDECAFIDARRGLGTLDRMRASISQACPAGVWLSTPGGDAFAAMAQGRSISIIDASDWTPASTAGYVRVRCHYATDPRKGAAWLAEQDRKYAGDPVRRARELEVDHEGAAPSRAWPEFDAARHTLSQESYARLLEHLPSALLSEGWDYGPGMGSTARVVIAYWAPDDGEPERCVVLIAQEFERPSPVDLDAAVAASGYRCRSLPDGILPDERRGDWLIHQPQSEQRSWSLDMRTYAGIEIRALRKDPRRAHTLLRVAWGMGVDRPRLYLAPHECEPLALAGSRLRWRDSLAVGAKTAFARGCGSHVCDALCVAYLAARRRAGLIDEAILLMQPALSPSLASDANADRMGS